MPLSHQPMDCFMYAFNELTDNAKNICFSVCQYQGFAYVNLEGIVLYQNTKIDDLLKTYTLKKDPLTPLHCFNFVLPAERLKMADSLIQATKGHRKKISIPSPQDGELEISVIPDKDNASNIIGIILIINNVSSSTGALNSDKIPTKIIAADKSHQALEKRNHIVFSSVADAIMIISSLGDVIDINPSFSDITGYTKDDIQSSFFLSSCLSIKGSANNQITHLLSLGQQYWQGQASIRTASHELLDVDLSITSIQEPTEINNEYVVVFNDRSKKQKYEKKLWQQTNITTLTQLPNRHYFKTLLNDELINLEDTHSIFVCVLDIDRFKWINDTLGYQAGDQLLKETALRLRDALATNDILAHLGSDEFAIGLLNFTHLQQANEFCQHLLNILEMPFLIKGFETHVSARAGLTCFPNDGITADELLQNADAALHKAKNSGPSQHISVFTKQLKDKAQEDARLERDLHKAICEEQLKVYYQPIVCSKSGKLLGAEALLRWLHPELGLISPIKFIPIAEGTELIKPIGCKVVQTALTKVLQWNESYGVKLKISVNVSGMQFLDPAFLAILKQLNQNYNQEKILVLEITESFLLDVNDNIIQLLNELKSYGVRFSLDDFGTGFSSLNQLRHFPVDFVKIDRSFVKNTPENLDDRHLCKAIIDMTHNLGLEVIGEGVENEKQIDILKQMKCDMLQGFYYSQPVCEQEFEQLIEEFKERETA